ncbi:MAG: hypothetical protein HOV66_30685 [Streptomycetaceae bacterium]|nr:hypothetical protein [Streptomycetaceae bacterium]NUS59191.1 hypothetical protein [Streptomycetaceae bacterium]
MLLRGGGTMQVQAKKIVGVLLISFVIYTIIATPDKASDLIAQWFSAISSSSKWVGNQIGNLIN